MSRASCVARIERTLSKLDGVQSASVNLATERASVAYDPTRVKVAQLISAVEAAGYGAAPVAERAAHDQRHDEEARRQRVLGRRRLTLGLGAGLSALVLVLAMVPS
jgi:Cu+-exporting ATPase